jgi:hypothetical protein
MGEVISFSSPHNEFKPRPSEGHDQKLEKAHVFKTVRLPFKDFDFVVDALNQSGVDLEVVPIQDPFRMLLDRVRQFHQQRDSAGPGRLAHSAKADTAWNLRCFFQICRRSSFKM